MLLERKNAIIYGGGGAIGAAVAPAFAAEGARVYLVGRTLKTLEKAAEVIRGHGGPAQTAQLGYTARLVAHSGANRPPSASNVTCW